MPGDKKSAADRKKPKKEKGEPKERPRRSRDKPKAAPAPGPAPAADPDAVQLFRRYDRSRLGLLSRVDFLQLVRDYASPPDPSAAAAFGRWASRPPLSLTDSRGVPLGYARADRNSEFEAGQLFERYDADRSGALSLDKFTQFFADFRPQLTAFVQDAGYFGVPVTPLTVPPQEQASVGPYKKPAQAEPIQESNERSPSPVRQQQLLNEADDNKGKEDAPDSLKRQYQAAIWELHKLCRCELDAQRKRIADQMSAIRSELARHQRSRSVRGEIGEKRSVQFLHLPRSTRRQRGDYSSDEDDEISYRGFNEMSTLYETLEADLDHIDEITRFLRRYHRMGNEVTSQEMKKFLAHAPVAKEEAQFLAMKNYELYEWQQHRRAESPNSGNPSPSSVSPPSTPSYPRDKRGPELSPGNQQQQDSPTPQHQHNHRERELEELLRIKDQMIYQLLQERAAMRRDKSAMESYLKTLSTVSSQEMQKWAQLTDEMQDEIERLRSQLPIPRRSSSRAV